MKVERLIQSIQTGSDRGSQKMLANYRTAFDVETLKYRFDGLDAKGFFNYTIYGTKARNPVEHQIKLLMAITMSISKTNFSLRFHRNPALYFNLLDRYLTNT